LTIYLKNFLGFLGLYFLLFFKIKNLIANVIKYMSGHLFDSKILSFFSLGTTCSKVILIKLSRWCWNYRMSLIHSFLSVDSLGVRPHYDIFPHKFYHWHQLRKNFHDTYTKLRNLNKLTRIFYFFINIFVPMSMI